MNTETAELAEGDEFAPEDYYAEEVSTFGDRVAAAREGLGFSQRTVATKLGIKSKTVQAWEEDRSEPRANKLQMLAAILNVSIIWLITGTGPGVEGPDDLAAAEIAEPVDLLAELRAIRTAQAGLIDRMQRLEKRLRGKLEP